MQKFIFFSLLSILFISCNSNGIEGVYRQAQYLSNRYEFKKTGELIIWNHKDECELFLYKVIGSRIVVTSLKGEEKEVLLLNGDSIVAPSSIKPNALVEHNPVKIPSVEQLSQRVWDGGTLDSPMYFCFLPTSSEFKAYTINDDKLKFFKQGKLYEKNDKLYGNFNAKNQTVELIYNELIVCGGNAVWHLRPIEDKELSEKVLAEALK